jgi:hypothetical protein
MKKIISLLILVSLILQSCKKDEAGATFKFIVSDDCIPTNFEYWVMVSDNSNVLYLQEIQNGQTYETPEIDLPLVDVHVFWYYETASIKQLIVHSYTDIAPIQWNIERMPASPPYVGQANVSIPDLQNVRSYAFSSSFQAKLFDSITGGGSILLFQVPENILISCWPSDNSPLRYRWVQNVVANQSVVYSMGDLLQATGSKSFSISSGYSSIQFRYYGYFSNYNTERYSFPQLIFTNTETNQVVLYYPQGLFENYYFTYKIVDDVDETRAMAYINYGQFPTSLPATAYANYSIVNYNSFDNALISIENPQDYHILLKHYSCNQSQDNFSERFYWYVYSKPQPIVSNPIPDIPYEIAQKSTFFNKNNLMPQSSSLAKFIRGDVVTYNDYINLVASKSAILNEKVSEYILFYKYPSASTAIKANFRENEMDLDAGNNYHKWD